MNSWRFRIGVFVYFLFVGFYVYRFGFHCEFSQHRRHGKRKTNSAAAQRKRSQCLLSHFVYKTVFDSRSSGGVGLHLTDRQSESKDQEEAKRPFNQTIRVIFDLKKFRVENDFRELTIVYIVRQWIQKTKIKKSLCCFTWTITATAHPDVENVHSDCSLNRCNWKKALLQTFCLRQHRRHAHTQQRELEVLDFAFQVTWPYIFFLSFFPRILSSNNANERKMEKEERKKKNENSLLWA